MYLWYEVSQLIILFLCFCDNLESDYSKPSPEKRTKVAAQPRRCDTGEIFHFSCNYDDLQDASTSSNGAGSAVADVLIGLDIRNHDNLDGASCSQDDNFTLDNIGLSRHTVDTPTSAEFLCYVSVS